LRMTRKKRARPQLRKPLHRVGVNALKNWSSSSYLRGVCESFSCRCASDRVSCESLHDVSSFFWRVEGPTSDQAFKFQFLHLVLLEMNYFVIHLLYNSCNYSIASTISFIVHCMYSSLSRCHCRLYYYNVRSFYYKCMRSCMEDQSEFILNSIILLFQFKNIRQRTDCEHLDKYIKVLIYS